MDAKPTRLMLIAALVSRSCSTQQLRHVHRLTLNGNESTMLPHVEHVFELGYHRWIITNSLPLRLQLILKLASELKESHVGHGSGEVVVFNHAGDIQVLDADDSVI